MRVIDLFREWDEDASGSVSKKEFRKAMPMLGLDVPAEDVDALFDSWDPDGSGSITFKELQKLLRTPAGDAAQANWKKAVDGVDGKKKGAAKPPAGKAKEANVVNKLKTAVSEAKRAGE